MATERFASYAAFWPHYLGEHSRPATRLLHAAGTLGGLAILVAALVLERYWLLPVALVFAYGLAWIGHFRIERNRPATFRHPLWSLRADFHMIALLLAGRLDAELARHTAQSRDEMSS